MLLGRMADFDAAPSRAAVQQAVDELITAMVDRSTATGYSLYLDGPPGIGKTHLFAAALDRAAGNVAVLRADGDAQRRHLAFGVVSQLVGAVPSEVHPAEYALDRVDDLCASGPVIVWVDDAHYADAASLAVLRRLVSSARVLPLAVMISARPFPLRERLVQLREQANTVLRLPPMDALMVERLVFEQLGRWPGPRLRHALSSANGNPLFIVELLRSLDEHDLVTVDRTQTVDLRPGVLPRPARLDQVVRDHLGQLDEATREVLGALAVFGAEVAVNELAELMFTEPADLDGPLDRAAQAGLVRYGPTGRVDFAHDVYREVTYANLPDSFRRMTHRRLAQVAEQRGEQSVLVAEHRLRGRTNELDAAAADPDDDAAVLAALRAAAAQTERYAPEVAADLLELAAEMPGGEQDDELLTRRVENLFTAGRGHLVGDLIRQRIGTVTDREAAARLQTVLIRQLLNRAEVDGVVSTIDRTTSIAGLPEPVRLGLLALQAWTQLLTGQLLTDEQATALSSEIAAANAGDAATVLDLVRGCQAFLSGAPTTAQRLLERAKSAPGAAPRLDGSAQIFYPWAVLYLHGPGAALDAVRTVRQHPNRDAPWTDPYLGFLAGGASLLAGEWDDATAEMDTALESAEEIGSGWLSIPVGELAYIEAHRGDPAAARARLERFRHRRLPLQFGLDYPGVAELAVLDAEGDVRAAATLVRSLWSTNRNQPARGTLVHAVDMMRSALLTVQPRLAAQIAGDLTDDLADARAGRRGLEPMVLLEATSELVHGMAAADPDQIASAVDAFKAQGWGWLRNQALEELACAAAAAGDRARASAAADEAVTGFERVGADVDRDRLLARTRALGLRRGPRQAQRSADRGWASLTATEQRVIALIREGLTNREIGARMFISPRTVQTHVSHILTKTGLRSRIDVATASAESELQSE